MWKPHLESAVPIPPLVPHNKISEEVKKAALKKAKDVSTSEAAKIFGISSSTLRRWKREAG